MACRDLGASNGLNVELKQVRSIVEERNPGKSQRKFEEVVFFGLHLKIRRKVGLIRRRPFFGVHSDSGVRKLLPGCEEISLVFVPYPWREIFLDLSERLEFGKLCYCARLEDFLKQSQDSSLFCCCNLKVISNFCFTLYSELFVALKWVSCTSYFPTFFCHKLKF